jgi:deoxyribodipyrimidine photo-lyase
LNVRLRKIFKENKRITYYKNRLAKMSGSKILRPNNDITTIKIVLRYFFMIIIRSKKMQKISIFWFRRDLRLSDNNGLYQALNSGLPVLPIFIFDKNILDKLDDKRDKRVFFIYKTLKDINNKLLENGRSLVIKYGNPKDIWDELSKEFNIDSIYTNHDYEPYSIKRDNEIKDLLESKNIKFFSYKDQVIFEKNEILSGQNKPYTVYTPYKNKWKETLSKTEIKEFDSENYLSNLLKISPYKFPEISELGFYESLVDFPLKKIEIDLLRSYSDKRDFPSINGTTKFGIHLRFGTVSIRKLVRFAQEVSEIWLNELIWREFFMMILYNFPHVENNSFRSEYDNIKWLNNDSDFEKWCLGQTGYPIVDAGMRELNETGYMHNRVRMITASFLTKHLLIDWKKGEKYFAKKLLDYEMSANNGNWQWAAGTGCDAAPYFRVFNPETQTQKFDKDLKYIKKWIPEFGTSNYVKPIIEHSFARERALNSYKEALGKLV